MSSGRSGFGFDEASGRRPGDASRAVTDLAGGFAEFPTAEVGKRAAALVLRVMERIEGDR